MRTPYDAETEDLRDDVFYGLAEEIHEWAESKGWHETPLQFGENCTLLHSEISEMFEEYRKHKGFGEIYYPHEDEPDKPEGIPIEMADLLIRMMHYCAYWEIPLADALAIKLAYNQGRPYRHGDKRA